MAEQAPLLDFVDRLANDLELRHQLEKSIEGLYGNEICTEITCFAQPQGFDVSDADVEALKVAVNKQNAFWSACPRTW